jgi:adenylate cyclase
VVDEDTVDEATEELWRWALTESHYGRFGRLPSSSRCSVCSTPFSGLSGQLARITGRKPSIINPHLCNYCEEVLPPGGAEVDVAIFFADVRGSTDLAERMSAREFTDLLNRFYAVTAPALIKRQAVIDKLIGDEVMAFLVPSNDPDPDRLGYRRRAVAAGVEVLNALGYAPDAEPWLPVALGIDAGPAFVGKLGSEGVHSFSAIGDTVNTTARLRSHAEAGEILLGDNIYQTVADLYPDAEPREIMVKGKSEPLLVHSLRPAEMPAESISAN